MNTKQVDRLQAAISFLSPLAAPAIEGMSNVHWVGVRSGGSFDGRNLCKACCEKQAQQLNERHPDKEHYVDGFGCDSLSDSLCYCSECSAPLYCTLTEFGARDVIAELSKPRSFNLFAKNGSLQAFEVLNALEAVDFLNPDESDRLTDHQREQIRATQQNTNKIVRRIAAMQKRRTQLA